MISCKRKINFTYIELQKANNKIMLKVEFLLDKKTVVSLSE